MVYMLTCLSYLAGPCIEVHVGKDDKIEKFGVYKGLIVERSSFFANALNGNWQESDKGLVLLPEDDPKVFALYLQVLNTDTVPIRKSVSVYVDSEDENGTRKTTEALITNVEKAVRQEMALLTELYVFSEKLQDSKSKNTLLSAMIASTKTEREDGFLHYPNAADIRCIYGGTMANNPMRRLLTDLWVFNGTEKWFGDSDSYDYPPEFLFDICVRMKEVMRVQDPHKDPTGDSTNYHE
jgi:hypothetical protein